MININDILSLLVYDESSPSCLRWNVDRYCGANYNRKVVSKGDVAGHLDSNEYWRVALGKTRFSAHRIIFLMFNNHLPAIVDHSDGNTLNNRYINLRASDSKKNQRNCKADKRNKSGVNGVILYSKVVKGKLYSYWRSTWYSLEGKLKEKYFSIDKMGEKSAFASACAYRTEMIKELNFNGAGYSDRHGTKFRDEDDMS